MSSKKKYSSELQDKLDRMSRNFCAMMSSVQAFNDDQTDNTGIIETLTELADFCELTGSEISIAAVRAALAGKSLAGCVLQLERVPV